MSQYSSTTGKEEVAVKLFLMNNILIVYLRKWNSDSANSNKKIPSATIVKKAWDSTDDNILG